MRFERNNQPHCGALLRFALNLDVYGGVSMRDIRKNMILTIIALALMLCMCSCNHTNAIEDESVLNTDSNDENSTTEAEKNYTSEVTKEATTAPLQESETPEIGDVSGADENDAVDPVTYEKYISMSAEDQEAFISSFASMYDFIQWYNEAEAAYESTRDTIEYDGSGDLVIG